VKKHRLTIAIVGLSVAAVVGGIFAATAGGSGAAQTAGAVSAGGAATSAAPGTSATTSTAVPGSGATVKTAMARVGGVVEVILVNDKGLPLYTYKADTTTQSMVTCELAALWPPLVASAPTDTGLNGVLAAVHTSNGQQVAYNGHFLYTFAEDSPGQVTGEGVQNFFVASPGQTPNRSSVVGHTSGSTTPPRSRSSYSY
jgi:predicted lipoprotein with Yx(FWY)xxD motif